MIAKIKKILSPAPLPEFDPRNEFYWRDLLKRAAPSPLGDGATVVPTKHQLVHLYGIHGVESYADLVRFARAEEAHFQLESTVIAKKRVAESREALCRAEALEQGPLPTKTKKSHCSRRRAKRNTCSARRRNATRAWPSTYAESKSS